MPDLVVDASIALAWGMPDESSSYAIAALAAVEQSIIYVPDLWAYEVANGLVIASRRQRITQADVQTNTAALSRLRLRVSRPETLTTISSDGTCNHRPVSYIHPVPLGLLRLNRGVQDFSCPFDRFSWYSFD